MNLRNIFVYIVAHENHLITAANNSRLLCVRCLLSRLSSDRMWEKVKIFMRETIKSAIEPS